MFLSIMSGLSQWAGQVENIFVGKVHHLTPQDYCIIIVFGISIGYCLLKGRNI